MKVKKSSLLVIYVFLIRPLIAFLWGLIRRFFGYKKLPPKTQLNREWNNIVFTNNVFTFDKLINQYDYIRDLLFGGAIDVTVPHPALFFKENIRDYGYGRDCDDFAYIWARFLSFSAFYNDVTMVFTSPKNITKSHVFTIAYNNNKDYYEVFDFHYKRTWYMKDKNLLISEYLRHIYEDEKVVYYTTKIIKSVFFHN